MCMNLIKTKKIYIYIYIYFDIHDVRNKLKYAEIHN